MIHQFAKKSVEAMRHSKLRRLHKYSAKIRTPTLSNLSSVFYRVAHFFHNNFEGRNTTQIEPEKKSNVTKYALTRHHGCVEACFFVDAVDGGPDTVVILTD
jgi:hypothetical protein